MGKVLIRCSMSPEDMDIGNLAGSFAITGLEEATSFQRELAATTGETIDVGSVNTVQAVMIKLVTGGSTAATGLSVDVLNSTWTAGHHILLEGECMWFRPTGTTMSAKNLSAAVCKYVYRCVGDNS